MCQKVLLSTLLGVLVASAAVATPLADRACDYTPLAKKQLPASPKSGGDYTMQGADLIADAPPITVGGPYTGTTLGYSDDYDEVCPYSGSTSPDVVYRFSTTSVGCYTFDLCQSGYDTKIYLYGDEGATLLEGCNDDGCPGYRSLLEVLNLPSGDHWIVIDGYGGDTGEYSLSINLLEECQPVECPGGAIDEVEDNGGCNSAPQAFQDVECGDVICGNAWVDSNTETRDTDWYRFELIEETSLNIDLEVDQLNAVLFLIMDDGDCNVSNDEIINWADAGCFCEPEEMTTQCLAPGVYYIFVAANTFQEDWDGNYLLSIECEFCGQNPAGDTCSDPVVVTSLPYYDAGNTSNFMDDGFNSSPDVFYMFSVTFEGLVTISLCAGSDYDSYLRLLADDCTTVLYSNDDACGLVSELADMCLPAGTYYAMVEGYSSSSGNYTLDISLGDECGQEPPLEGDNCAWAFEITSLPFSDSGFTCDFNDDDFRANEDVYYHFTLEEECDLIATLCNGSTYDTYIHLLSGDCSTEIAWNDDYCGLQSQMDLAALAPGEYFIVVEGYSNCGEYLLDVYCESTTLVEPTDYQLYSNYPNPFNPATTIDFSLAEPTHTTLIVFSVTGETVATLVDAELPAGEQSVVFDASDLTSGVYFYMLRAGNFTDTKKMILVK